MQREDSQMELVPLKEGFPQGGSGLQCLVRNRDSQEHRMFEWLMSPDTIAGLRGLPSFVAKMKEEWSKPALKDVVEKGRAGMNS